jgi:hypothetical protein
MTSIRLGHKGTIDRSGRSGHKSVQGFERKCSNPAVYLEPPIGIGTDDLPLRVACCLPVHALPAPIARIIALAAPTTVGLSGTPFREPVHGRGAAGYQEALIGVIVDRQGSDAGVGRCRGSRLTGADGRRVRIPAVTQCVGRSTRYPPVGSPC